MNRIHESDKCAFDLNYNQTLFMNYTQRVVDVTEAVDALLLDNPAIIKIVIRGSGMKRIPASVCGLLQLQSLALNNNSLEILDPGCFMNLSKLLVVLLRQNKLTEIPDHIFDNNNLLKVVDFSRNKIRFIGLHLFANASILKDLEYISLRDNMLTSLEPWPIIRMNIGGTLIDLSNNRFHRFTNELNWIHKCDGRSVNGTLNLVYNRYKKISDLLKSWSIDQCDFIWPNMTIETKPYICDCMEYWWFRAFGILNTESCISSERCQAPSFPGWPVQPPPVSLPLDMLNCTHPCFDGQCTCTEIPHSQIYHIKCHAWLQFELPDELPKPYLNIPYHFSLDFSNNQIKYLAETTNYLVNVTSLDLSNNRIDLVDPVALRRLQHATEIKLHGNHLQRLQFDDEFVAYFDGTISLHNNPWHCTCHHQLFQGSMQKLRGSLLSPAAVLCDSPKRLKGYKLLAAAFCRSVVPAQKSPLGFIEIAVIVLIVLYVLFIIILLSMVIRKFMYRHHQVNEMKWDDSCDGEYDAFMSFAWDDRSAVRTILEFLEDEHGFTCCTHDRNFSVAEPFMDQMGKSIDASRRVLCFLSPNFIKSKFCIWEFKYAFEEDDLRGKRRLVAIMVEPVSEFDETNEVVQKYISKFTYLDVNDPDFMKKLIDIMPSQGKN